ncbi:MAG TPA: hypothetical protein VLJ59_05230 [Mycobacteriales bacterium]|nr:hypothetical protein [Mycobacteriales bacterium]
MEFDKDAQLDTSQISDQRSAATCRGKVEQIGRENGELPLTSRGVQHRVGEKSFAEHVSQLWPYLGRDTTESAADAWTTLGRPACTRYGLTATPDKQPRLARPPRLPNSWQLMPPCRPFR